MLKIKRSIYEAIITHLLSAYPLEACGLLAGKGNQVTRLYQIKNILQSPTAYEMDAKQQITAMLDIETNGWSMVAIYHSHPHGPQIPSETDIQLAYYPEAFYVIVSLENKNKPVFRVFKIQDGHAHEVDWKIE
jgi:[CysO sulfur-carrier protein]-S-L-cysteine hydrolase